MAERSKVKKDIKVQIFPKLQIEAGIELDASETTATSSKQQFEIQIQSLQNMFRVEPNKAIVGIRWIHRWAARTALPDGKSFFRSQTVDIKLVLPQAAQLAFIFIGKTIMLHLLKGPV